MKTTTQMISVLWWFCLRLQVTHELQYARVLRPVSSFKSATLTELNIEEVSLPLESYKAPTHEIERRRNFAIISHPDAGNLQFLNFI